MSVTKEKNTKQNKTKSEAWAVINKYHRLFHICFGVIKLILIVDIESYKVAPESQNPQRTNNQKIKKTDM